MENIKAKNADNDIRKEPNKPSSNTNERKGIVSGCEHLCVRKAPKTNAEIVAIIAKDNKVKITGESGEWYVVTTELDSHFVNAISGYCMKKYISVG